MRRRLESAAEHFVEVSTQSDREIAERILSDEIDVLVDLKGHTYKTRSTVLAYRPAPIQVNFLGYPGTLGPGLADYIIGDQIVTPADHSVDYSEKLALMPHTYQPNDRNRKVGMRPPREDCGLPASGFVFCCFNNAYKITRPVFSIWCRLLLAVEGSVLWLMDCNHQARTNLLREATAARVDASRIVFASPLPLSEHLGRLQNADLVLDTFPYNAHTTASDALWSGVPIVTRPGETFASRVAASLLIAAGLPQLVTNSIEDYEHLALSMARSPDLLARTRAELAAQRAVCPLFDSLSYTRSLESLYTRMFDRYISGLPPDHLFPITDPVANSRAQSESCSLPRDSKQS
jgi:predicted O-linked N-acetylglucosamine transferase (SPINDLY family)